MRWSVIITLFLLSGSLRAATSGGLDESLLLCPQELDELKSQGMAKADGLDALDEAQRQARLQCAAAQTSVDPEIVSKCEYLECSTDFLSANCPWQMLLVKIPIKPVYRHTWKDVLINTKSDSSLSAYAEMMAVGRVAYSTGVGDLLELNSDGDILLEIPSVGGPGYTAGSPLVFLGNGNLLAANHQSRTLSVWAPNGNKIWMLPWELGKTFLGYSRVPDSSGFAVLAKETDGRNQLAIVYFFDQNGVAIAKVNAGIFKPANDLDPNTDKPQILAGFTDDEVLVMLPIMGTMLRVRTDGVTQKIDFPVKERSIYLSEIKRNQSEIVLSVNADDPVHRGMLIIKDDFSLAFTGLLSPLTPRPGLRPEQFSYDFVKGLQASCISNAPYSNEADISVLNFYENNKQLTLERTNCQSYNTLFLDGSYPLLKTGRDTGYGGSFTLFGKINGPLLEIDSPHPEFTMSNLIQLSQTEFGFFQRSREDSLGNSRLYFAKIAIRRDGCLFAYKKRELAAQR